MTHNLTLKVCAILFLVLAPAVADEGPAKTPPPGIEQLAFFIGNWEVELLGPDAKVVGRARTQAYFILDRTAIQDDWRSLDAEGKVTFRGTSIRTFVPATKKWVVHWAMAGTPGYTYIDAEWVEGELRGSGRGFDGRGEFVERYRYYDVTDSSYSFQMERSYDGGESWQKWTEMRARKLDG